MPIPYMGSKSRIRKDVCDVIAKYNKHGNNIVVDLFCGGLAVSEELVGRGYNVIANDKNKYVVALANSLLDGIFDYNKALEFVDRDTFKYILCNREEYEDWYVGYVMQCWSFGNNQKCYLLGKQREFDYLHAYNLIVYCEVSDHILEVMQNDACECIISKGTVRERRLEFRRQRTLIKKTRPLELESLERLQRLESLERLQRLESLQSLQSLERLTITCKDYKEVNIPDGSIVYCDPPYQGTAEYELGGFSHKEFWDYIKEVSATNVVLVSEYQGPSDFAIVYEKEKSSTFSGKGTTKNQPTEKIFMRGPVS